MRSVVLVILLSFLLLSTGQVSGQGTNAILSGTVTDPSNAIVPGAMVIARNVHTGVFAQIPSNEAGIYSFVSLQPGTYQISAEMQGFRMLVYDNIKLDVGARINLNLRLELGAGSEAVEVTASIDASMGSVATSVGRVVTEQMINDLPLVERRVLDLAYLQAGVSGSGNFNGARIGTLNITRDGFNVQDNLINMGIWSSYSISTDLIQEFRVVTSPADVELGRGSGQIQMLTRSGTNAFHGAAWDAHRNTVLNANTWANNQRGINPLTGELYSPRNRLIHNEFGSRIGGPILKNKTFFFFSYEGRRIRTGNASTSTVLTDTARKGIFRFFPGAQNANALAKAPTVDLSGNPVKPSTATGDLQAVNIFGRDPYRKGFDPTGTIQRQLKMMPSPNNFRIGDGLNTAGYTWQVPGSEDGDEYNVRVDHNFSSRHKLNFVYTFEKWLFTNYFMPQNYPTSPPDAIDQKTASYSLSFSSTLTPTLLNEACFGILRPWVRFKAPWELPGGAENVPRAGGQRYLVVSNLTEDPINGWDDPQGRISPVYQYGDTVSWRRGRHALVWGGEVRFVSSNGFSSSDVMPRAYLGTGAVPVEGLDSIAGIGTNLGTAEYLLVDLSGSLDSVYQAFNSRGGANPVFLAGEGRARHWKQREFALFLKDEFKVTPALSMNLGLRYEYYSVPYDAHGMAEGLVGGSAGVFGVTGAGFADLFQPGLNKGAMSRVQLVGRNSPNPGTKLYNDDWNNLAPGVGLSWSIPYWGKNKTVVRLGYGIGYERNALVLTDQIGGDLPGLSTEAAFVSDDYLDLSSVALPLVPAGKPLSLIPITERTQSIYAFDTNLRTPYVQNWNVSIQRQLTNSMDLEVRYVGSKGTRLINTADVNERNIFETGILDAFKVTQTGGNSPLLDQLFKGLYVAGLGIVNGTTITGSDAIRRNSTTQGYLASNSAGMLANYLWTTSAYTGQVGGLPRRAGLPENWVAANPQFRSASLVSNYGSSTYHSLQAEVIKRFSGGWAFQGNHTFGKTLGEDEATMFQNQSIYYRTLRNRSLQKKILSFSRTHMFRSNGTYTLPFGPGKRFLNTGNSFLSRVLEQWTVGAIFSLFSGYPLSFYSTASTFNNSTNTPMLVGNFPTSTGSVTMTPTGPVYFVGYTQVPDPYIPNITTKNGIQGRSTLLAIADPSGKIVLSNPTPGVLGTMAPTYLTSPGAFRLDANLIKRIRIREGRTFEMRATAMNLTNTPQWSGPITNINSTSFGRIMGASGNRIMAIEVRLIF